MVTLWFASLSAGQLKVGSLVNASCVLLCFGSATSGELTMSKDSATSTGIRGDGLTLDVEFPCSEGVFEMDPLFSWRVVFTLLVNRVGRVGWVIIMSFTHFIWAVAEMDERRVWCPVGSYGWFGCPSMFTTSGRKLAYWTSSPEGIWSGSFVGPTSSNLRAFFDTHVFTSLERISCGTTATPEGVFKPRKDDSVGVTGEPVDGFRRMCSVEDACLGCTAPVEGGLLTSSMFGRLRLVLTVMSGGISSLEKGPNWRTSESLLGFWDAWPDSIARLQYSRYYDEGWDVCQIMNDGAPGTRPSENEIYRSENSEAVISVKRKWSDAKIQGFKKPLPWQCEKTLRVGTKLWTDNFGPKSW
jgi:hypothetical protein